MTFVLGRDEDAADDRPAGHIGQYRARDGSHGEALHLDLDGPHAALIVGKRGYGKSYTLGVIVEELARTTGVAPVVIDPMGVFTTLAAENDGDTIPATVEPQPAVDPATLDPRSWCALLDLSAESAPGGLLWQAASEADTLDAMCAHIEKTDAPAADKRAATNHLTLARSWEIFDPEGLSPQELASEAVTVLDVSGLDTAPMNAVVRAVGEGLYRARVDDTISRLPWLVLDEVHTFFDGVGAAALRTILTRGRAPGVSLVMATQRPGVVPDVAVSQSDLLVAHRLTAHSDIDALERAQPTYMHTSLEEQLPTEPGDVLVVDDATETVHTARIRKRDTPHGGDSPSVSERF